MGDAAIPGRGVQVGSIRNLRKKLKARVWPAETSIGTCATSSQFATSRERDRTLLTRRGEASRLQVEPVATPAIQDGRPRGPRRWPGRLVAGAALAIVPLVLAACGTGGRGSDRPNPSPTGSVQPSASASSSAAADVIAAWNRYWQIYVAVGSEMRLPDARLAEVATGDELHALNTGFLAFRSQGQLIRGSVELAPKVVAVDEARATLSDCYASHVLRYSKATGQPLGREPSERSLVTVSMVLEGGSWKVAGIRHEGDGCTPAP